MDRDQERERDERLDDLEARLTRLETVVVDRLLPVLDAAPFLRTAPAEPWLPRPLPTGTRPAQPRLPTSDDPLLGDDATDVAPAAAARPPASPPPLPTRDAPGLASPEPSTSTPSDPPEAPDAPPTPRRAPDPRWSPGATPAPRRDLERFVGVAVLGRVGIGALMLAAGYFAQWTYVRIPPVGRVGLIYALAALLVGAGALLRRRVAPTFIGILWGGGTAVAYLAGVVARLRYDLVDPTTALAMLVGASMLGDALARKARLEGVALVAISGAVVAPLLVGSTADHRTALLVYLLAVYAWGMFVARQRGWSLAGIVALCGNVLVASLWLASNGGHDVSTYLHVHAYLVGWTLPLVLASVRSRVRTAPFVPLVGAMLLLAELILAGVSQGGPYGLARWFSVVAGAGWAAAALALRGAAGPDGTLHRWFARIAGGLLVVGAVFACVQDGPSTLAERGPLVGLLAVASLSLLARPRLGVGDGVAFAAALVATALTALGSFSDEFAWRLVPIATAMLVVVFGSSSPWRVAGFVVAAAGAAVAVPVRWVDPGFLLVGGFGAAAVVAAIGFVRAATLPDPRGDRELEGAAALLLAAATLTWLLRVLGTSWGVVAPAILNPGTVAGAVLLVTCAVFARPTTRPGRADRFAKGLLQLSALALVVAGVGREVHGATSALAAADVGRAIDTLAFTGIAGVLALFAGRRGSWTTSVGAALAWLVAAVHVLLTIRRPGGPWTAALQVLSVAAPPYLFLGARRATDAAAGTRAGAVAVGGLFVALAMWILSWASGRFAGSDVLVNARFATGALLVAGLASARGGTPTARHALAVLACFLSVVVAVPEVLEATRGIDVLATRRALVSVYVALHTSAVLGIGFRRRDRVLRWLALAGYGAVVVKVGLFDLASVETPVRVLVTGCLGAILLAAAGAYARRMRDAGPPRGDDDAPPSVPSDDAGRERPGLASREEDRRGADGPP
ncbi:MAG: DUF2339 domain-containing protein [Planctomycetota bacterium]